jgi:hypothetical protein
MIFSSQIKVCPEMDRNRALSPYAIFRSREDEDNAGRAIMRFVLPLAIRLCILHR